MAGMLSEELMGRMQSAGQPGGTDPNETIFAGPEQAGGDESVSPEEQAKYEQFLDGALKVIYNDKTKKAMLSNLGQGDAIQALSGVAALVASRVTAAAVKAGDRIDPAIALGALEEIIPDLAEFASEAGVRGFSQEEIDGAFIRAVDIYRDTETKIGNIDPQEFAADFEEMMRADQEGRLGEVVPGIEGAGGAQAQVQGGGAPGGGFPPMGGMQ